MLAAVLLLVAMPEGAVAKAEVEAQQALAAGEVALALERYEAALRLAEDFGTKARLRDAYRAAGWAEPRPVALAEEEIVRGHVLREKVRVFDRAAARLARQGRVHAAILVRRALIRLHGEGSDQAKREERRIEGLVDRLTKRPTEEEKELARRIVRSAKDGAALLEQIAKLMERREWPVLVRVCQELEFGDYTQEEKNEARRMRKEAERRAAEEIPDEERALALEVLEDDRFKRLALERSRHFLFVGPAKFVTGIPKRERTLLDLAYIYQSDLAARHLTADGKRIVIYYQETFDFGGALAGGKLIRVGNRAIRLPVAGGLHYHELGHCIFGRGWLHHGFTEGLADFAAGFTLDALGQTSAARNFILAAREEFVRFYLGRDVRYFRIQPYKPSAGFLFSFLPPGEAPFDWAPYRRVFRRMGATQFGTWPKREHQIMRFFGYYMATEYGPELLERLRRWGWPVGPRDLETVPAEAKGLLDATKQGEYALVRGMPGSAEERFRTVLRERTRGHLANRARFGLLRAAIERGDGASAAALRRRLGIVDAFKVLGPYHARGKTAWVVFPPEVRIGDLERPVRVGIETARWKDAKVRATGYVDLRRGQGFGYPENACAFALFYVHAPAATAARIWTGSDDGHQILVNGRLLEKRTRSRPFRFDEDFVDVDLPAGWSRVLLKVHNTGGEWGFLVRIVRRDGEPIPGLRVTTERMEDGLAVAPPGDTRESEIVREDWKSLSKRRWAVGCGSWDTRNGRLRPLGTERRGRWNRFVVDPDRPAGGPANLLWLRDDELAATGSFSLLLDVVAGKDQGPPAKFGVTVDGERENDAQSGHTLVFEPAPEGKLACRWYRYDRLLYLQPGVDVPEAEVYRFRIRRLRSVWTVTANGVPLFAGVDAPRLPAFSVGLMTWGRSPELDAFRLAKLLPAR